MKRSTWTVGLGAFGVCAVLAAGCGGASTAPPLTGGDTATADAATAGGGDDQASKGAALYAEQCADCHSDKGEGAGKASPIVGKTALPLDPPADSGRKVQFKTAADVIAFVQAAMPPKKAGSLTDEQASAIVAFALKANGVDVTGKTIDKASAAAIVLHP